MEAHLKVYRVGRERPVLIGRLDKASGSFTYDTVYLESPSASPLSVSLPLRSAPFAEAEARAYFDGLVPEGVPRKLLAAQLHTRDNDYLAMLAACGMDCIGDLSITPDAMPGPSVYDPISRSKLRALFSRDKSISQLNATNRLSLAGTQNKIGLAHAPSGTLEDGWYRATGSAASTHILKVNSSDTVSYLEFLCMNAASRCGLNAAETHLLDFGIPTICSTRFDRLVEAIEDQPPYFRVIRLHQEDFAQAFGMNPGSKYTEIDGGSIAAISRFVSSQVDEPALDLQEFARLICFNYLIGNCDNHLKNLSLLYGEDWLSCSLAPLYDLVCTTWFPDLSRDMCMAIGGVWDIDNVTQVELRACAKEIGIGQRLFANIAHDMAERIVDSISASARKAPAVFDEVGWKADELIDDIAPRRLILSRV